MIWEGKLFNHNAFFRKLKQSPLKETRTRSPYAQSVQHRFANLTWFWVKFGFLRKVVCNHYLSLKNTVILSFLGNKINTY